MTQSPKPITRNILYFRRPVGGGFARLGIRMVIPFCPKYRRKLPIHMTIAVFVRFPCSAAAGCSAIACTSTSTGRGAHGFGAASLWTKPRRLTRAAGKAACTGGLRQGELPGFLPLFILCEQQAQWMQSPNQDLKADRFLRQSPDCNCKFQKQSLLTRLSRRRISWNPRKETASKEATTKVIGRPGETFRDIAGFHFLADACKGTVARKKPSPPLNALTKAGRKLMT